MGAQRPTEAGPLSSGQVAKAFAATALFRGLDPGVFQRLAPATRQRRITKGEVIFRAGDQADGMYILVEGTVCISLRSADGDQVLNTLEPVATFGDLAVLDGGPRSATATATAAGIVLIVSRNALLASVRSEPALVDALFCSLGSLLRTMTKDAADQVFTR